MHHTNVIHDVFESFILRNIKNLLEMSGRKKGMSRINLVLRDNKINVVFFSKTKGRKFSIALDRDSKNFNELFHPLSS